MTIQTKPFDASKYLVDTQDHADLLTDALETGHHGYVAAALGVVAKARGMSQLAEETGLSRQSLYSALSAEGNPTLGTVIKVLNALGFRLAAKPLVLEDA